MQLFWAVLLCFSCIKAMHLTEEKVTRYKGLYPKRLESRITHGYKAELGQFPWQVGLLLEVIAPNFTRCGGSLIDKNWILTAAHCFKNVRSAKIYLGTTHFGKSGIKYDNGKYFLSSEFYIHPKYDDDESLNDIALIKLSNPVELNENIRTINLIDKEISPFSKVVASGWGVTHKGKTSKDLLYADMITLPREICEIYSSNNFGKLCAASKKEPRRSTCYADSGGPLAYYDNTSQTYFLVGITSHSSEYDDLNCKLNFPEYFTNVYTFREWIHETMKKHSN